MTAEIRGAQEPFVRAGGCACRALRYRLTAAPLIVHACHCRDCQRLTGSAFVINLWIERCFVEAGPVAPASFRLAAPSAKPHEVFFCPTCATYLWSKYHAVPGDTLFVRAGTLDDAAAIAPDVHIFTRSKLAWLELPRGALAFDAFYDVNEVWPAASRERLARNIAQQG
jgi:hypothetical protein